MDTKIVSSPFVPFFVGLCFVFCTASIVFGQKPTITGIDKSKAATGELLTISGSNFGTDATKLVVFLGGARGTIQSLSDQLMEVRVPPGATFDNIRILNLTSGLIAESRESFFMSFDGQNPFDPNNLEGKKDFTSETGIYDLCLCDFDNDGKLDVATSANKAITVHPNTTAGPGLGNITFGKISFPVPLQLLQIKCGDINGDGKPDIIATDDGASSDRIFILVNKSSGSISFDPAISIQVAGNSTKTVEIADLDLDGKVELIVTDQGSGGKRVSILQDVLSGSPVRTDITIPGAVTTDGLAIEDLNGDLLPEIITSQFNISNSNIFVLQNKSIPGGLSFTPLTFTVTAAVKNIKAGDLDGDRKSDIAFTQLLSASVGILRNTSTASTISFAPIVNVLTDTGPWGLDFGDLDGDKKPDIVVTSQLQQQITILNNNSAPGTLSFTRFVKTTSPGLTRHINIGDLDNDGKSDIAFTTTDPFFSIFRNKTCIKPILTPSASPVRLCDGLLPFTLSASVSRGAYYEWKKDGVTISCGVNQNTFDVTNATGSGKYTVVIRAEGNDCVTNNASGCTLESAEVEVIIGAGSAGDPMPGNNGPVCIGSDLKLFVGNDIGATEYRWTGPNGYTGTGVNPPTITNFTLANAGRYYVDVIIGTCLARRESTVVEAIDVPNIQVGFAGSAVICQGDPSKTLSIVPVPAGFTFQWKKDGVNIGGATSSTFTVTSVPASSGNYSVVASFAGCTSVETAAVAITVASAPTASFTIPATACAGQQVVFNNQSTVPSSPPVEYKWNFGDSQISSDENPIHIYSGTGSFSAVLTVSYANNACPDTDSQPITITPAPAAAITNPDNDYKFCPGETLKLEVIGSFTSYAWNTGATTPSIDVTTGGEYSVDLGTTVGCTLTAKRLVEVFPEPQVIVAADPAEINEGEISQLTASGLLNYSWTPTDPLSDPSLPNPTASPVQTTVFTVTGTDTNGCIGTGTIELRVRGEAVVNKLGPKAFFSPNGDASNPLWLIDEIDNYPQCNVAIYDDKGIKVFEAKPYLNNWDGTYKGKQLPDGVYYYIIRCDGEEATPRSGSITILR